MECWSFNWSYDVFYHFSVMDPWHRQFSMYPQIRGQIGPISSNHPHMMERPPPDYFAQNQPFFANPPPPPPSSLSFANQFPRFPPYANQSLPFAFTNAPPMPQRFASQASFQNPPPSFPVEAAPCDPLVRVVSQWTNAMLPGVLIRRNHRNPLKRATVADFRRWKQLLACPSNGDGVSKQF